MHAFDEHAQRKVDLLLIFNAAFPIKTRCDLQLVRPRQEGGSVDARRVVVPKCGSRAEPPHEWTMRQRCELAERGDPEQFQARNQLGFDVKCCNRERRNKPALLSRLADITVADDRSRTRCELVLCQAGAKL